MVFRSIKDFVSGTCSCAYLVYCDLTKGSGTILLSRSGKKKISEVMAHPERIKETNKQKKTFKITKKYCLENDRTPP